MGLVKDAVNKKNSTSGAYSMNLEFGGQNGYMARIGKAGDGVNYDEWMSNQAYVKKNIIPIVLTYPKFLDWMPNSDYYIKVYKALLELHPLSIEGLVSGLTVETDSHPIGAAGQVQEEITNVTRAVGNVTFNYKEKAGKAIQKFLDTFIRYGYMDPDIKRPLISEALRYGPNHKANNSTKDLAKKETERMKVGAGLYVRDDFTLYTPDYYTGTMLFIEPDTTMLRVVDAWLVTNMFFKGNGDRTGSRNLAEAGSTLDISVETAGITMCNDRVFEYAENILNNLTVHKTNPDTDLELPSHIISSKINSATEQGYNQAKVNSTEAYAASVRNASKKQNAATTGNA